MILFNCFTSKINRLLLQLLVWTSTREMWHVIIKSVTIEKKVYHKSSGFLTNHQRDVFKILSNVYNGVF